MIAKSETGTASGASTLTMLSGWNVAETAGAAAVVTLRKYHETPASGEVVAVIKLAADASDSVALEHPIDIAPGPLYCEVTSGAARWAVYGR